MGDTKAGRSQALMDDIRQELMATYAANFQKGLGASDSLYFAKVHQERNRETGQEDMHAHIIVSRKDMANKLKLSPATNHQGTQKGAVKGGFDRETFVRACELDIPTKVPHDSTTMSPNYSGAKYPS